MPFSRPPLTVGPGAHAAPESLRGVPARLHEIGREDLAECAELAISELVANAFLHGSAPIRLALRGTAAQPVIEVHDTSPHAPRLPGDVDADVWATGGRGLSIVARAALTWGVTLENEGKTVWFEPAADLCDEAAEALLVDRRTTAP